MAKPRKCKVKGCDNTFEPYNSLQKWCSPHCGVILAKEAQEKARKAEIKAFNRETRKRKEKLKSRSDWLKEAQRAFNRYIRLRDKGDGCISCGKRSGAKVNAGHYKTVGANPELRFNEDNCHLQCEWCNSYLSGNIEKYRKNLKDKIGDKRLAILEGPHEPKKYTVEEIKGIKAKYTKLAKELENG